MSAHSRYNTARKLLIFWCLFIGIGALGGASCMLIRPDGSIMGMQEMLPFFQVLPFASQLFQNFLFPGIALLCVNGIPNLAAAGLLLAGKKSGIVCGALFGLTLMAWIVIQFVIFPPNFMSSIYFVFGILQALTGMAAWIFYQQEHFTVREEDYPHIGSDPRRLVVWFSRMGYTKMAAYEEAQRTGAVVYQIQSTERTQGTPGFWWCGRYGMHRWDMPIEKTDIDLSSFDHVTLCSPIWVFHLSAPMRAFCRAAQGQIKEADYILTHFSPFRYKNAVLESDRLLGIRAEKAVSLCVRRGKVIRTSLFRG